MAEYVLGPTDDQETVARALLDAAGDPDLVMWSPRPNMHPHGGVYVINDEHADRIIAAMYSSSSTVETVLGVPAGEDDVETDEEEAEDDADDAIVDDPNTPEDEHQQGQDRVAARKAARAAARAAAEQKSE